MKRVIAQFLTASCLISAAYAQFPGAAPVPAEYKKGYESITIDNAKRILGFLAGPECEGRGSGQPGFQKAADFMAKEFKAAGLKPLGEDGTYFQSAIFTRSRMDPTKTLLEVFSKGTSFDSSQVVLNQGPDDLNVTATPVLIVYSGKGARVSDELSLKDRIVILKGDVPNPRLASQCLRQDAVAVLMVVDKLSEATWRARMGEGTISPQSPSGTISAEAAKKLIADLEITEPAAPAAGAITAATGKKSVRLKGKRLVEKVKVPNVVGMIEGSDPTLKAEIVGVGGHLDHLGKQGTVVYPGADDDGSGSTAVALVAHAMAASPVKPKRSIIFMTFFGEEMGLLGSSYLVNHPMFDLKSMVTELQMDMVGRDSDGVQNGDPSRVDKADENRETIRLVGSKRISTELDATIQDLNKYVGFKFKYDAEDVYTRSDHYNFAAKGIPIAFLFDGFHPDYHQPTDTVDKINFLKLTNAAKLYFMTALKIANQPEPPKKDVTK